MNYDDGKLPNLKVLVDIRIAGALYAVGRVFAKKGAPLEKSEWQELIVMGRLEQTDDSVNDDDYDELTGRLAVQGKRAAVTLPGA